jgi:pyruvate dehydrogenase E1 component beta subunit
MIPEGTNDVAVNTPIATILADGESAADLGKAAAPAPAPSVAKEVEESRSPVGEGKPMISAPQATAAPAAVAEPDPEVPEGTEMISQTIAKRCATRWPKRCDATPTCSSWARRSPNIRAPTR